MKETPRRVAANVVRSSFRVIIVVITSTHRLKVSLPLAPVVARPLMLCDSTSDVEFVEREREKKPEN